MRFRLQHRTDYEGVWMERRLISMLSVTAEGEENFTASLIRNLDIDSSAGGGDIGYP